MKSQSKYRTKVVTVREGAIALIIEGKRVHTKVTHINTQLSLISVDLV